MLHGKLHIATSFVFTFSIIISFSSAHIGRIAGDKAEHFVYSGLEEALGSVDSNGVVVLHGCSIRLGLTKDAPVQEYDFLIIDFRRKIIIGIEAKNKFDTKAFKQLPKYQQVVEKFLGDQLDSSWKFIRVACFYESSSIPTCPSADEEYLNFVITKDTNITDWFKIICEKFPVVYNEHAKIQMQSIVKWIIFTLHIGDGAFVTSKIGSEAARKIAAIGTAENCIFFSKEQLPLIKSKAERYKKVAFLSFYSTGKTMISGTKCEVMAIDGDGCLFVMRNNTLKKCLLQLSLESKWSDPKFRGNITIKNSQEIVVSSSFDNMHCIKYCFVSSLYLTL